MSFNHPHLDSVPTSASPGPAALEYSLNPSCTLSLPLADPVNTISPAPQPKRKPGRHKTKELRATYNAAERQRRGTLNGGLFVSFFAAIFTN